MMVLTNEPSSLIQCVFWNHSFNLNNIISLHEEGDEYVKSSLKDICLNSYLFLYFSWHAIFRIFYYFVGGVEMSFFRTLNLNFTLSKSPKCPTFIFVLNHF